MKIPSRGMTRDEVTAALEAYRVDDVRWREGRAFTTAYVAGREVEEVGRDAFARFVHENALDPTSTPSAARLETEVVGMALSHLNAGPEATGNLTSGGTESIILAVKAARDRARRSRPNLVMPITAHAAFRKAAHYLGVETLDVDVDRSTLRADVGAMRDAITEDTILLVGSAPCWPYGLVDPIPELGRLALEKGLPLHVDACVGGFLLPYFRRLGASFPDFDFRVPGVTSISVDLHKFGFVPKGASLILYRDKELRRHQIYACVDWPGYAVVNATVQSSRSVGPIAAAWAVLRYLGDEGYLDLARRILEGVRRLVSGLDEIPGLTVLGRPDFALVVAASREGSVFHIADEMKARGWDIQVQLGHKGLPPNLHFLVTPGNAVHLDALLRDLREAVRSAREAKPGPLGAMAADLLSSAPPSPAVFRELLSAVGVRGGQLPERRAEIYELLNALPRPWVQGVVVEYFSELLTPPAEAVAQEK